MRGEVELEGCYVVGNFIGVIGGGLAHEEGYVELVRVCYGGEEREAGSASLRR